MHPAVNPGLTTTFSYLGWNSAANWLSSATWITWVFASVFNVVGFLFVVFGVKSSPGSQKIVMIFGIGGILIVALVFTLTTRAAFIAHWNATAGASHSPGYQAFIHQVGLAAGRPIPTTWNWGATFGTMVVMSWLFAYAYSISFIAGEVKRPDKTIILANLFAILVPLRVHVLDRHRHHEDHWLSVHQRRLLECQHGPISGYHMPFTTDFISLAVYCLGALGFWGKTAAFLMGFSYIAFTVWWLALSYLAFPRILFAWGMDRMGPKWFTDINPRYASPVKNHILCLVLSEVLLVIYSFSHFAIEMNVVVTGMQVTSVFLPTALAALLFPYMKRCQGRLGLFAVQEVDVLRRAGGGLGGARRPRLPAHLALCVHLQLGRATVHDGGDASFRRRLVGRRVLVLRVEMGQRQGRYRRRCDLRRAAA